MIRKITLIVFAIVISVSISRAQTFTWGDSEETGYQMNPAMVKSINVSSVDGSIWFISMKEKVMSYQNMMGHCFIIKYDSDGNREAEYIIQGALIVNEAITDINGNLIISGDYYGGDIEFWDGSILAGEENQLDGFLAEISPQGNLNWFKNIEEFTGDYVPLGAMKYANGKIYLATSNWAASFISTIDQDLNYTTIITQDDISVVSSLDIDSQSNLYVTGSCAGVSADYNGYLDPTPFTYSKYLVKYNASNEAQWVEYVEDITCIFPQIKVDLEDNIYWAGPLYAGCTFDTIQLNGAEWVYDFFVAKYNSEGNVQWAREIEENDISGDAEIGSLEPLAVMPDNSVIVACKTRGTIDWGNGIITTAENIVDNMVAVVNFDENGIAQWAKTGGKDSYSIVNTVDYDQNGNLIISGIEHEALIFDDVQIDSETFYYPFIVNLETGIVADIQQDKIDKELIISPNPAVEYINISALAEDISSVRIYSLNGRLIMENQNNNRINIQQLINGIYIVQVTTKNGFVTTKKLAVQ